MNANRRSLARESLLIAALTVLGALLRFWAFGRLSLTHFDEGIYAFSGLWIGARGGPFALDPMVIPYAPPGFPVLVGLSFLTFGVSDHSAILVATVCGVATIPVIGWLGRRTFGPGAGASVATFAALSLAHIAFSRKAMTDAPFLLAWLVSIGLGARFLERPGPGRALAMGLAVGLAQNFKYNGWLAGVLVGLAAMVATLTHPEERRLRPLLRTYGWGLLVALTAGLIYVPWFGFVSSHGGYPALIRHHRGYLGGLSTWWPHWNAQLAEAFALSGSRRWAVLVWITSWISCGLAANGARLVPEWTRRKAIGVVAGLGCGAGLFALQANLSWWVGLGCWPWLLLSSNPSLRLLATWWLVLSIMTPFYHPYARLWLPLHAVGWLLLGGMLARFGPFVRVKTGGEEAARIGEDLVRPRYGFVRWGVAMVCLSLSAFQVGRAIPFPMPWSWVLQPDPRRSFRDLVFEDLSRVRPLRGKTLRVLARRPLAFYLAQQGRIPFQLEPGLERLSKPGPSDAWAIVDEAMLDQEGGRTDAFFKLRRYWQTQGTYTLEIDPVTLLDIDPSACLSHPRRDRELWVLSPRNSFEGLTEAGRGHSTNSEAR